MIRNIFICQVVTCAVLVLFCAGCVNYYDRVALVADYKVPEGKTGGFYVLSMKPEDHSLSLSERFGESHQKRMTKFLAERDQDFEVRLARSLEENASAGQLFQPAEFGNQAPVAWTFCKGSSHDSTSWLGLINTLVSGLTLGIWPCMTSETTEYTMKMEGGVFSYEIPVEIEERQLLGLFSLFCPTPAWAEWRGKRGNRRDGVAKIAGRILVKSLKESDYKDFMMYNIVNPSEVKKTWLDEHQKKDELLRKYVLKENPDMWQKIQEQRAQLLVKQNDIRRIWEELKSLGKDPLATPLFQQQCSQYSDQERKYFKYWKTLEKEYLFHLGNSGY